MFKHEIVVSKKFERKSAPDKIRAQIKKICDRALDGGRENRGWSCVTEALEPKFLSRGAEYSFKLSFTFRPKGDMTKEKAAQEFSNIVTITQTAGNTPGWVIETVDGQPYVKQSMITAEGQELMPYAPCEIRKDWHKFYNLIYDREYQINIMMSRIQAAIDSDWHNRFHCALVGEPAGGKTDTARATKAMLGNEAVLELDATSTTQAGVIKELGERSELPRVIIIEEIEKADFKQLPWLLSMLDPRGEIRKLNYRSKVLFQMRGLCIATINDWKLFKNVMDGALASRFGSPIFFPRPSELILRRILTRDVLRLKGGRTEWIDPALAYCKEMGITDPRDALSICLSGKDSLLGKKEYQEMLRQTRIPENYGNV